MASSSSSEVPEPSQSYTTMDSGDVEAIGARCQLEYCNQLDFLPFRCESCKGKFCLEHRTEFAHKCPNEGAWAAARRRKELGTSSAPDNSKQPLRSFLPEAKCSYPQCKTIINTPRSTGVHCQTCNRMYCLKHRMLEEHDCKNLTPLGARPASAATFNAAAQTEKARVAFARLKAWGREKQKDIKLPAAMAPKPSSNAARLAALNKLKKSAKGDDKVPADSRVYLHVEAEAASTTSKFPRGEFFYNKAWSIGRVLDAAAKSLQVQNVNNHGGGEEEKLRVFHVEGGRLLEFSEKVDTVLASGNTIVLLRGVGPSAPDLIQAAELQTAKALALSTLRVLSLVEVGTASLSNAICLSYAAKRVSSVPPLAMNPTSVTTVSSTIRPRNKRLTTALDGGDASDGGTSNSLVSPIASPVSSRAASPIPSRHPSRTVSRRTVQSLDTSNNGRPLGGLSLGGTQTPVAFASGLWENSWSTLQGLASTVLGSDALEDQSDKSQRLKKPHQQRRRLLGDAISQHRRAVSAIPRPPSEWGPLGSGGNTGDLIGIGSAESREAMMRSKRREELLVNGGSSQDLSGRYKRRTSDDMRPVSLSVPPDHERGEVERDALVYIHHVHPNDTLAGVVIQFNCQMSVLRRANRLWPNDTIQSRKIVVLPVDTCGVKGRPVPEPVVDLLGEYDSNDDREYMGNNGTSWGAYSLSPPPSLDKQNEPPTTPPTQEHHEDPPWKHQSWVEIDGIPGKVEIARLPRKSLGFFPPSRRKSVSYSDLDTPSASVDLPRSIASSSQGRSRSGSYLTSLSLHGPGGVGTLGAGVYIPGPAEDGLNKYIATHLPSVLPLSYPESSSKASGLENVGNAIEGWVRKIATRAAAIVEAMPGADSNTGGDLIELTGGPELGDDGARAGDGSGGTTGRQGLDGSLRERRRGRSRGGIEPGEN